MSLRSWAACTLVLVVGCATSHDAAAPADEAGALAAPPAREGPKRAEPPPSEDASPAAEEAPAKATEEPKRTAADPFGDVGFKEVNQKNWLAGLREKLAQQERVPPTDLRVSPGLLRVAYVRLPPVVAARPGRRAPARRHDIVVVDNQGRRVASFRAVTAKRGDEPPKDLRFLSEERLVYEVVEPPPEPLTASAPTRKAPVRPTKKSAKKSAKKSVMKSASQATPRVAAAPTTHVAPLPPARTFVIQAIAPRARPVKCVGVHFTFTHERDKLAFVAGSAESAFVAVDGAQVYPRRGRTIVASAPAWSKDGRSLAFLEARAERPTRLVLLAELDNATGDTTWDLPPAANTDGALVFWAGSGKLVVGRTQLRPIFSASFTKESPPR
jgi:hypothetical protein